MAIRREHSPRRVALVVGLAIVGLGSTAWADARGDLQKQTRAAMESYDSMDYDAATRSLKDALATAKKAKLDKDPTVAKAQLYLGIASYAAGDEAGTKGAFAAAVAIDPKIQIDAAYKSPELVKLLEAARVEASGSGTEPARGEDIDCDGVKGIQHTLIDTGTAGVELPVEAIVGGEITPTKVSVLYRAQGKTTFTEAKLVRRGCKYTGSIPAAGLRGTLVHYYIAAYDANNRVLTSKGTAASPNLIELAASSTGGGGGDGEVPGGGDGGGITGTVPGATKAPKIYVSVSGGTGFGYVTGVTEANNEVQNCCIGNSLVVLWPELGYHVNRQLSIGLAARIGLPIGANVDPPNAKHSTVAPGAVIRVRYALAPSGEGLRITGQIGGGVMRNTIKLEMQPNGGNTDIVAQGPLLIGAGIGFKKSLSSSLAFVADVSVLAGIAVVDKLGTARLNSGIGGDLTLGLSVGF